MVSHPHETSFSCSHCSQGNPVRSDSPPLTCPVPPPLCPGSALPGAPHLMDVPWLLLTELKSSAPSQGQTWQAVGQWPLSVTRRSAGHLVTAPLRLQPCRGCSRVIGSVRSSEAVSPPLLGCDDGTTPPPGPPKADQRSVHQYKHTSYDYRTLIRDEGVCLAEGWFRRVPLWFQSSTPLGSIETFALECFVIN